MAAIAVIACNPQEEVVPEITVATTDFTLPVAGTEDMSFKVDFTTNVDWTAALKEASDWCSVTPSSGVAGEASVTIIALENKVEEERTATLVLTAGAAVKELVLTQEALFVPRLVAESSVSLPTAGGSAEITVNATVEFTAAEEAEWLTCAVDGKKVTFTATENTAEDARTATVVLTNTEYSLSAAIEVVQDGTCKVLWEVSMKDVMNRSVDGPMFSTDVVATGVSIAVYDGNVVVCAGDGSEPVKLNKATGEKVGTIATGDFKPYTVRQDDAGNLVMANRLWNRWTAYGNWFRVAYLAPGATAVTDIAKDIDEEYLGLSMNVRGDVTKDAVIALPHNNGEYVNNVISLYTVTNGTVAAKNITIDGNYKAVGWAGPYFGGGIHNHPGLALMGPTVASPAVSACYDANILQTIDLNTGATAVISSTPLAGDYAGNFAPNGIDIRTINGKQYMAVALSCFYATTTPATVYLFDVEANQLLHTWDNPAIFDGQDAASTNYNYVQASVTLEAADGGVVVYLIDKSTGTIAAKYFTVK